MRRTPSILRVSLVLVALLFGAHPGFAQRASPPPAWSDGFGIRGAQPGVLASVLWDDGSGPAVYFGGAFDVFGTSRSVGIARFDGVEVRPVGANGAGVATSFGNPGVHAFAVHDFGGGPTLVAGGVFESIDGVAATSLAAWDGSSWSAVGDVVGFLGRAGTVDALHSDGESLWIGGAFASIDGTPARNVGVWRGGAWLALDSLTSAVNALAVATVGGHTHLYAGRESRPLGRWNGTEWKDVPGSQPGVRALAHGPGGLLVGGDFQLSLWTGTTFEPLSADAPRGVRALLVHPTPQGPRVYAGGKLLGSGLEESALNVWDGKEWTPVGSRTPGAIPPLSDHVHTLTLAHLDDRPRELFVGGSFTEFGGTVAPNVARVPISGRGPVSALTGGNGSLGRLVAAIEFDDGSGRALYVSGSPAAVGAARLPGVARLMNGAWEPVGEPFRSGEGASAFVAHDDGSGRALYAVGRITRIGQTVFQGVARWDGSTWSDVGGGLIGNMGSLNDVVVWDDGSGPVLVVGGSFARSTTLPGANIAQWDGTTWSHVGGGLGGGSRNVQSLAVHDDGTGPKLYAGGDFDDAGGVAVGGIARWDGATWEPVGSGVRAQLFDEVLDLESVDVPALGGRVLVAAGEFSTIGGRNANGIGVWKDGAWEHVAHGFANAPRVRAVATYDDGTGAVLVAGGDFLRSSSGNLVRYLARFVDGQWTSFATSLRRPSVFNGGVWDLLATRDERGEQALWVVGGFGQAGAKTSMNIARWARPVRDGVVLSLAAKTLELRSPHAGTGTRAFVLVGDRTRDGVIGRILVAHPVGAERKQRWNVPSEARGRGLHAQAVLVADGAVVARSQLVALD